MRTIKWLFTDSKAEFTSRRESSVRPRHWILGVALVAAFAGGGCPKDDPLQIVNVKSAEARNQDSAAELSPTPVPEPATALLFGTALLIGGSILRWRRGRSQN